MKVVINGKAFDTDGAIECHRGQLPRGSEETLYASEKGGLFVIHQALDGEVIGGVAVTDDIATDWLEEFGAPQEAYERAGIELEEVIESPVKGGFPRILSVVGSVSLKTADGLIRLMRTFRPDARRIQPTRRTSWPAGLKRELMRRQDNTCTYCGYRRAAASMDIDHIVPVVRGGSNAKSNLQVICRPCNQRKGLQTDEEFRARYSRLIPQRPLTPPRSRIQQREFSEETQRTSQVESVRHFRRTRFIPMRERVLTGCLILGGVVALVLYLSLTGLGLHEDFALWPSLVLGAAAGLGVLIRAHLTGAMLEDSELADGNESENNDP